MKILTSLASFLILLSDMAFAAEPASYSFPNSRKVGQIEKVSCHLEVGGEIKHISEKDNKEHSNKMAVDCKLIYDEKTLAVAADSKGVTRSVRYYEKAEGVVQNGDEGMKPTLRDECKLIVAEAGDQTAVLFSPKGKLNDSELELIEISGGNSLLFDRLLPEKPAAIGEAWRHSEQFMAQFLSLDEVGQSDVQSTLKEVTDKVARFEMSGQVAGVVDGVSAEIEIQARYRYDRRRNRIDWIGMLIKEKRGASPVNYGLDVVARLQATMLPQSDSPALADAKKDLSLQPTPDSLQLEYRSKRDNWELIYDRSWKIFFDVREKEALELHYFDKAGHIALCTISPLLPKEPDKLVTLETFQEELRDKLGKEFGEFVEASESPTLAKYRLLRVSIRGTVSDLPMRWIYYHIADSQGRQAVIYFVLEEKLFDRLAGADKKLVESFRFTEPKK
jgi:hypothetical protein